MYLEQTFEEQLEIENKERKRKDYYELKLREIRGENIYIDFCLWCNCYATQETKKSERAFAKWLKQENLTLTEYQRRWIAENHFGWQFTWNEEKKEWESMKICKI